ncbi:MAG: cytidylate kinase family protein [Pseudomonadota bacterium]
MTSVIVSSDVQEIGQLVGEKTASALGYKFIGRSLLSEVAERYQVKEDKLLRALERGTAPKLSNKADDYLLSCIQTVTLEQLLRGSVVCTGLAAHLYVRDVSHVLMLRVLSNAEARINALAAQKKISTKKASKLLEKERVRCVQWSTAYFAIDESAPSTYDIVISLDHLEIDKVIDIVKDMTSYRKFKPMTYSRKRLKDLALASRVRTALLCQYSDVKVSADGDIAIVFVKCSQRKKQKIAEEMKKVVRQVPGVKIVQVHAVSNLRNLERQSKEASAIG